MVQQLKFVNQGGFPTIQSVSTTTSGTVTTFSFNEYPYRQTHRFSGGFWVKIPTAVAETDTNTVQFDTLGISGSAVPVYLPNGAQATVANFTSTSQQIRLCFYDRDSNRVQLIA